MRKLVRCFATCFLLGGTLLAYTHPCPGGWAVDAQFLYLLPSLDDTYFVTVSPTATTFPNGERENNDLGFQPGFRVGGVYSFCDCDWELFGYYTRLRATESVTITGDHLWATTGVGELVRDFANFRGSASSEQEFFYQRADGMVEKKVYCCCGLDLYLQGGLEYAYLKAHENLQYNAPNLETPNFGNVNRKSRTWGLGPQAGLEFDYDICQTTCCLTGVLSLTGAVSGSLLASKSFDNVVNTTIVQGQLINVLDHDTWRVIPAWHARIGLNYETCFRCLNASVEVGYEFNSYVRGWSRTIYPERTSAHCFTDYYNLDLQGLYVSTTVSF